MQIVAGEPPQGIVQRPAVLAGGAVGQEHLVVDGGIEIVGVEVHGNRSSSVGAGAGCRARRKQVRAGQDERSLKDRGGAEVTHPKIRFPAPALLAKAFRRTMMLSGLGHGLKFPSCRHGPAAGVFASTGAGSAQGPSRAGHDERTAPRSECVVLRRRSPRVHGAGGEAAAFIASSATGGSARALIVGETAPRKPGGFDAVVSVGGVVLCFRRRTTETPMSTMNREVYDALLSAGADETKAREAAKSVARYDTDIAEIKASLLLLKRMVGFTLAFVVALTWRVFQ